MRAIVIAGTVITNKEQALDLIERLNNYFDGSYESALAIDQMQEQLVNAGFVGWNEII